MTASSRQILKVERIYVFGMIASGGNGEYL